MNIFRKILKAIIAPNDRYTLEQAHADIRAQKRQEYAVHLEQLKSISQKREEREIKSGIVIDPGGTCLCKRCGHTVSALYDHCDNCCAPITWNA